MEKIISYSRQIKIVAAVLLAAFGWICIGYGIVAADMIGNTAGALAVILIEIGTIYLVVSVILGLDLFGSRRENPVLHGRRLTYTFSALGFLSSVPVGIIFLPVGAVLFIYILFAAGLPLGLQVYQDIQNGSVEITE